MTTRFTYELPTEPEVIEIDLGGEVFTIMPLSGLDWRDFIRAMAEDTPTDEAEKMKQDARQADLVFGVFENHMDEQEYERFAKCIQTRGVDLTLLLKIIQDVIGGSAERPTSPPLPLEPGRPTTGATSTAAASSPDLT